MLLEIDTEMFLKKPLTCIVVVLNILKTCTMKTSQWSIQDLHMVLIFEEFYTFLGKKRFQK